MNRTQPSPAWGDCLSEGARGIGVTLQYLNMHWEGAASRLTLACQAPPSPLLVTTRGLSLLARVMDVSVVSGIFM
ncbi:hypothetical protein E2C01_052126 [Portunus trituberculatus]|uniref:Uncharacterized protein n=1 Tax=Portunus trituberculatus TaxID=210409 RepID=A0A5B7GDL5_PORTR|nr:hypothetical protein [Portunus trituberculatus]